MIHSEAQLGSPVTYMPKVWVSIYTCRNCPTLHSISLTKTRGRRRRLPSSRTSSSRTRRLGIFAQDLHQTFILHRRREIPLSNESEIPLLLKLEPRAPKFSLRGPPWRRHRRTLPHIANVRGRHIPRTGFRKWSIVGGLKVDGQLESSWETTLGLLTLTPPTPNCGRCTRKSTSTPSRKWMRTANASSK